MAEKPPARRGILLAKNQSRGHDFEVETHGLGLVMFWNGKSVDDRQPVSRADLQSAITDAVKRSDPDCEVFVDVIVEHAEPKSQLDVNWILKGVKFGRSDRDKAAQAVAVVVARMQREFRLAKDATGRRNTKKSRPGDH